MSGSREPLRNSAERHGGGCRAQMARSLGGGGCSPNSPRRRYDRRLLTKRLTGKDGAGRPAPWTGPAPDRSSGDSREGPAAAAPTESGSEEGPPTGSATGAAPRGKQDPESGGGRGGGGGGEEETRPRLPIALLRLWDEKEEAPPPPPPPSGRSFPPSVRQRRSSCSGDSSSATGSPPPPARSAPRANWGCGRAGSLGFKGRRPAWGWDSMARRDGPPSEKARGRRLGLRWWRWRCWWWW